jgi:NitT/TauT family transport system permease protein
VGVVVAEFFGSFAGYGYAIMAAGQTFDTATLLAYVFILGVFGLLGSLLLELAEKKLAPWRYE